ncbi:MAG: lytic transglycosylase domain-containing protein, partial [Desulfuromonadaceae bacterium]
MSGCTATRLERSADVSGVPVSQADAGSVAAATLPTVVPETLDAAGEGENENTPVLPPDVAEINSAAGNPKSAEKGVEDKGVPNYDFPVVRNAQVEELVNYYTKGRGRRSFEIWLERSGRYLPLMQQTFAEEGLPQDLAMLALIESGFNSNAHSWANAVGYWQFIESTGRMYGLENTWWRDERRDVEKATRAAAQYLSDLYARFDDWYLAAAAYNAGPGKMLNAIKRHNSRDFWRLAQGNYLRAETKRYIPKLLAAIIIAKQPEHYGFDNIEYAQPLKFDTVAVSQPTDLEVIVELTGVDYATLKMLNTELKRWCTPPGVENYVLRVPPGAGQGFSERYAQIPPTQRNRYRRHELKAGENLAL